VAKASPSLRDHRGAVDADVFKNFEVNGVSGVSVGGGDGSIDPHFDGGSIFEDKTLGRSVV
jgi:hypothetical protein